MKSLLAVQHTCSEFLGAIEKQFENRGIGFRYVRLFTGQAMPVSALQYAGAAQAARVRAQPAEG